MSSLSRALDRLATRSLKATWMRLEASHISEVNDRCRTEEVGLGRVAVHRTAAEAFAVWDCLESVASASAYQTRAWLIPWLEAAGPSLGVTPFIIVAYDEAGGPLALLPFGVWRQGLQTIVGFLGGRDSNFNLGLFRPGVSWTPSMLQEVLRRAIKAASVKVDLFQLCNQPRHWEGGINPFLALPHQPSPSFCYKVALTADPDVFIPRLLSGNNRKKLRQKTARLEAIGLVRHDVAKTPEAARATIDAYVEQRLSRCRTQGLSGRDLPRQRALLERSSIIAMQAPPVELHALYCGNRIVATFAGTSHQGRYSGMVMSFDASPDIAQCSPGEILLERIIRSKCREGYPVFDLGIGEARYKQVYCPESELLFDSLIAISPRAKVFVVLAKARLRVKRRIKQSPWAWAAVRSARKLIRTRQVDGFM